MSLTGESEVLWIAVGVGVIALILWWWLPKAHLNRYRWSQSGQDKQTLEREIRENVGKAIAGALALFGFTLTFQEWKTGRDASRRDYIAREYATGFTLLSNADPFAKVGGIYKLEEVAKENSHYRSGVRRALESYIRKNATSAAASEFPQPDIQAALSAISRGDAKVPAEKIRLSEVDLRRADVSRSDLSGFTLKHATLSNLDGWCVNLYEAELYGAKLDAANLPGANFANAYLCDGHGFAGAVLDGSELTGARFYGACIRNASFKGAKLAGSAFNGLKDFTGTDFSCLEPGKCADVWKVDFRETRLSGARFVGTIVKCANFIDADLRGAVWGEIDGEDAAFYCRTDMPDNRVRNDDCLLTPERKEMHQRICGDFVAPTSDGTDVCPGDLNW